MNSTASKGPPYLVDGHVHLHASFDVHRFFEAASANFSEASNVLGLEDPSCGILMLTESSGVNRFSDLPEIFRDGRSAGANVATTEESRSLWVTTVGKGPILVIAGRQIVTSENLEVLALGCNELLPDGDELETTLDRVEATGAISVIPWGFGKWILGRRRTLLETLRNRSAGRLFLGDNGGRPAWWPKSTLFRLASELGLRDLPGTDPLPFAHEELRAGSFGFIVEESLDPARPAAELLRLLSEPERSLEVYGQGANGATFIRNQIAMQIRKRTNRGGQ